MLLILGQDRFGRGIGEIERVQAAANCRGEQGDEEFWDDVKDRVRDALDDVERPQPQMVTLLGLVIEDRDSDDWDRIGDDGEVIPAGETVKPSAGGNGSP